MFYNFSMDMGKFKFYLPRVLAIFLIAFVSIFALDVFSEPDWPVALLMHLIPSFILVVITAIAWKNEKIGGILFFIAGLIAAGFFHSWTAFFIVSVPAILIGLLFLENGSGALGKLWDNINSKN